MWRNDVSINKFDYYRFNNNHELICLNGKTAREENYYYGRHPKAKIINSTSLIIVEVQV